MQGAQGTSKGGRPRETGDPLPLKYGGVQTSQFRDYGLGVIQGMYIYTYIYVYIYTYMYTRMYR